MGPRLLRPDGRVLVDRDGIPADLRRLIDEVEMLAYRRGGLDALSRLRDVCALVDEPELAGLVDAALAVWDLHEPPTGAQR